MSADDDRNLLFGAFACQMNLVSRDQLVAAVDRWSQRKDVPLSQVLVEEHSLLHGDVKLIDQLIERSVAGHKGDVTLCLESVQVGASGQGINELPTLAASAFGDTGGGANASSGNGGAAGHVHANRPPDSSRFEEVAFHAQGGLGEVWKARDAELGREVALKRIKARFSSDEESRIRFAWEAEITGNLEHPGIVPVYGFGRYSDGRPYYAMRFIRGESLKHEIEQLHAPSAKGPAISPQNQAFRRLLKSFIDTCNTIHFAHSAGIIHRDIKPANIMVGRFGETLVVDWGLAKKLNSPDPLETGDLPTLRRRLNNMNESTATQMGTAVGTPAYMSPEQAAGRWDTIGSATDIYSLGATLYHLIAGRTCIETRDLEEFLTRVKKGDFPKPAEVNAAIPKPLSAICVKAMALAPENRYATARDLAEDLECWLSDQEVSAYPESRLEKVSRWVRQNTTKVYAIAGSTLVVVVAAIAIAIASRNAAIASRNAAQEKAKGFTRLQQERAAVDEWVTGASQALNEYAGAQYAREEMLKKAVEHYEAFAAEEVLGNEVVVELARNWRRLGDVQRRRGATAPEKLIEAEASFQKAAELLESLRKDSVAATAEWTQTRIRQALILADGSKDGDGLQLLAETRNALSGKEPDIQESLAHCLLNEGSILLSTRKLKLARERLNDAAALCDQLVAATPQGTSLAGNETFHRRLRLQATAQAIGGHCQALMGELRQGRQNLEVASDTFSELAEKDHTRRFLYLEDLASTRVALGDVLRRQAQYSQAEEQSRQAIAELKKLGEIFSDAPRIRELIAAAHVNYAWFAFDQGNVAEAHAQLIPASLHLAEARPFRKSADEYKLNAMALLDMFGEVLRDSKSSPEQLAEALGAYQEVQDIVATVSPAMSQEAGERSSISLSHKALLLERQGEHETAETLYRNALAGLEKVVDSSHTARHAKALVHTYLGNLLHGTERADKAAAEYKHAISIWTALATEAEPGPEFLNRLAWLLTNCRDQSQRDFQLARSYVNKALRDAPTNPGFLCTSAAVYLRQDLYEKSVGVLEPLQKSPDAAGGYMGHVLALLAINRWKQDQPAAAQELLKEAIEWRNTIRPGNPELRDLVQEAEQLITVKTP
jgi:serine/threonine-protein kinase